jgi:uncharacterized LabA/DUF88 family protein
MQETFSSPSSPTPRSVMVYIDGFNLYFGMKEEGLRRFYWLDVQKLAQSFIRPQFALQGVRYFSARISGPPSKQQRQSSYLQAIENLVGCTTHYGQYQNVSRQCTNCQHVDQIPNEKMTDVNLAVELLTDAFNNSFDTAIIVSADSDLSPPIEKVRSLFPQKRVMIAFPPGRNSKRLMQIATGYFYISRSSLAQSQLPNQITLPSGYVLNRPQRWT